MWRLDWRGKGMESGSKLKADYNINKSDKI